MSLVILADYRATKKALATLNRLSAQWCEDTDIDGLLLKMTRCEKTRAKVKKLMRMSYEEGAYAGRRSVTEQEERVK